MGKMFCQVIDATILLLFSFGLFLSAKIRFAGIIGIIFRLCQENVGKANANQEAFVLKTKWQSGRGEIRAFIRRLLLQLPGRRF